MTQDATKERASGSPEGGADESTTTAAREVAYYGALVGAWINNRMELDKTLVALSSAGIGLLVTLATVVGASAGFEWFLYCSAVLGFVATVVVTLIIYHKNSELIERLVNHKNERAIREYKKPASKDRKDSRPSLRSLDFVKLVTFVIAVAASAGLVLAVAARKL